MYNFPCVSHRLIMAFLLVSRNKQLNKFQLN